MISGGYAAPRVKHMQNSDVAPEPIGYGRMKPVAVPSEGTLWKKFRSLSAVRTQFGLGRGVMSTFRAMLSFLKEGEQAMIYAANKTISERAEGCPERSVRRHVAQLLQAGLIIRRSSSNGKRYRVDHPDGEALAFGFDVSPFLAADDLVEMAKTEAQREAKLLVFFRRKLGSLIYTASVLGIAEELILEHKKILRRKVTSSELEGCCIALDMAIQEYHQAAMATCGDADARSTAASDDMRERDEPSDQSVPHIFSSSPLPCPSSDAETQAPCPAVAADSDVFSNVEPRPKPHIESSFLTANDGQNDRHKFNTKYKIPESEARQLRSAVFADCPRMLERTIRACPDLSTYSDGPLRSWYALEDKAFEIATWIGIGRDLIRTVVARIGRRDAALRLLAIFNSPVTVNDPNAYFNAISIGSKATSYDAVKRVFANG